MFHIAKVSQMKAQAQARLQGTCAGTEGSYLHGGPDA